MRDPSHEPRAPEANPPHSHQEKQLTRGLSIEDYDPLNPQRITEPASRHAMSNLCILPFELQLPPKEELDAIDDPDVRSLVLTHHRQRVDKLIAQITDERRRILSGASDAASAASTQAISGPQLSAVEMEQRQIEKLKQRQQREVEQILSTLLVRESIEEDAAVRSARDAARRQAIEDERTQKRAEAHERHMRRLQELEAEQQRRLQNEESLRRLHFEKEMQALQRLKQEEADRRERAREEEAARQARAEEQRRRLEEFEEERRLKIVKEEERIEAREAHRLATLREEQERRQAEKELLLAKRQEQIAAAREHERALLEKLRIEGEQRDLERETKMMEFEARKREEQQQVRAKQEEKVKRFGEAKLRLEEAEMKRRQAAMTTDAEIAERVRRREQMIGQRAENARLQRSDQAVRSLGRAEEWKRKQELKYREMKQGETAKEVHIQEVLATKEKDRKLASMQRKLKEEEKMETASRLDRQRELRRQKLRKRVDASMARVEAIQAKKADIYRHRQDMLAQLQREKFKMSNMLVELVLTNQTNKRGMQRLAQTYGLDLAAIQRRADARGGGRLLKRTKSASNVLATPKRTVTDSRRSESARRPQRPS
jgi:hypothetical protein